ncbi:response regulator [Amaricoccus macauensis]|uniref:response regulator n=1 Tax=Amaricoccus macauensis TaxID=57001 RepID=UPI003C79DA16
MLDRPVQEDRKSNIRSASRKILVVDDDPMSLLMLEGVVQQLGFEVLTATNGQDALASLANEQDISIVLLDRVMPGMDGLTVVRKVKKEPDLCHIPIVMITGSDDPEEMREGIEAGVFYYLSKPVEANLVGSVISAALRGASQLDALNDHSNDTLGFDLAVAAKFQFRTPDEAQSLAGFLANFFPNPERSIEGIAALLLNAVEHGICGIGFDRKGDLLADGLLKEELRKRLDQLPAERKATAAISRKTTGVSLVVEDPGDGFAWKEFVEIDFSRSQGSHGRGIAQAKATAFDEVKFNSTGNCVVAVVRAKPDFDW